MYSSTPGPSCIAQASVTQSFCTSIPHTTLGLIGSQQIKIQHTSVPQASGWGVGNTSGHFPTSVPSYAGQSMTPSSSFQPLPSSSAFRQGFGYLPGSQDIGQLSQVPHSDNYFTPWLNKPDHSGFSLNDLAQEILRFCESDSINLQPQFIAGSLNVVVDALSRSNQVLSSEWTLHQEVVDSLFHRWPATVDLFATNQFHRLPVYFSPMKDPMSVGTDSMLHTWDNLQVYAFPSFSLIQKVLNKLSSSNNTDMTLIAPFWPQKPWFPDLLELLTYIPLCLPIRVDLLRQPHCHRFHQNLRMLRLTEFRLSCASRDMPESLLKWLNNYLSAGGSLLEQVIKLSD